MLKDTDERVLKNSRLAVVNTFYIPLMVGCVIISSVYLTADFNFLNILFGWVWLGLSFFSYGKYKKARRHASEMEC